MNTCHSKSLIRSLISIYIQLVDAAALCSSHKQSALWKRVSKRKRYIDMKSVLLYVMFDVMKCKNNLSKWRQIQFAIFALHKLSLKLYFFNFNSTIHLLLSFFLSFVFFSLDLSVVFLSSKIYLSICLRINKMNFCKPLSR